MSWPHLELPSSISISLSTFWFLWSGIRLTAMPSEVKYAYHYLYLYTVARNCSTVFQGERFMRPKLLQIMAIQWLLIKMIASSHLLLLALFEFSFFGVLADMASSVNVITYLKTRVRKQDTFWPLDLMKTGVSSKSLDFAKHCILRADDERSRVL